MKRTVARFGLIHVHAFRGVTNAEKTLLELFYSRWRSQTLYAGIRLGVFEVVHRDPQPADQVAARIRSNPILTYRMLRALAALGVLIEHADRAFSVTAVGEMLRGDHPRSLRDAFLIREGTEHTAIWKHLSDIVREGTHSGFVREYGTSAFEYAARSPTYATAFNAGMTSLSNWQTGWVIEALRNCDFISIRHLCDIGGGQGHLLCHLLVQYPHLTGTIFERLPVVEANDRSLIDKLRVGDRCSLIAGDMFVDVPQADAYIMKMILHDWSDQECVQILANLRRRAIKSGRVFIVEHLIPDRGGPDYAALYDMHMMCWGTGKERTVQEYRALLEASGWALNQTWFPGDAPIGVVDGIAA